MEIYDTYPQTSKYICIIILYVVRIKMVYIQRVMDLTSQRHAVCGMWVYYVSSKVSISAGGNI